MLKRHECVICGKIFYGNGNNAKPIKKGLCCYRCNIEYVIKARITLSRNLEK